MCHDKNIERLLAHPEPFKGWWCREVLTLQAPVHIRDILRHGKGRSEVELQVEPPFLVQGVHMVIVRVVSRRHLRFKVLQSIEEPAPAQVREPQKPESLVDRTAEVGSVLGTATATTAVSL